MRMSDWSSDVCSSDLADLYQGRTGAAACRPAPLRADVAAGDQDHAGWADARRDAQGVAGGEFEPGRRDEGYLGVGGLMMRIVLFPRHCERSEAIQSGLRHSGLPRRFAPRNDQMNAASVRGVAPC